MPDLQPYDPWDSQHVNFIIKHFDVKVDLKQGFSLIPTWGYSWRRGCSDLKLPEFRATENEAKAIAALAIYLHWHGVHYSLDDWLAVKFILASIGPKVTV